ncbi:MAG: hypothetical protein BWK80_29415, partial [Desulfobacteraceae bacterium IS3]
MQGKHRGLPLRLCEKLFLSLAKYAKNAKEKSFIYKKNFALFARNFFYLSQSTPRTQRKKALFIKKTLRPLRSLRET